VMNEQRSAYKSYTTNDNEPTFKWPWPKHH
jgi:hypothetical protein